MAFPGLETRRPGVPGKLEECSTWNIPKNGKQLIRRKLWRMAEVQGALRHSYESGLVKAAENCMSGTKRCSKDLSEC